MKRPCTLFVAAAIAAAAHSQLTPFEIGAGYAQSGSFTRDAGGRTRIEGPEFSISQAWLSLPFVGEARVGASGLFDSDEGTVLRLFARYKSPSAGPNGIYGLVGVYWAWAEGKTGSFSDRNGTGVDLGGGLPLGSLFPGLPSASLEFVYHQGEKAQLKGWSAGLTVRF